jgi:O-methyltransferase
MSSTKTFYRTVLSRLPCFIQDAVSSLRFRIGTPKLLDARAQYQYTDEHLKFVHLLEAMNYLRVAGGAGQVLPQTFFEFGCHSGRTFSAAINASRYLRMDNAEFFAFDSFEGLPATNEAEDGYFQTGTFCTSRADFVRIVKEKTGMLTPDSNIVQGFYCDSLTPALQAHMPKAGVVHIDVDLYSSTVDVLRFLKPLLVSGSLLVFDDWYCFPGGTLQGERKALAEFLEANSDFAVEPWKAYSTFGQSFFVTRVPNIL